MEQFFTALLASGISALTIYLLLIRGLMRQNREKIIKDFLESETFKKLIEMGEPYSQPGYTGKGKFFVLRNSTIIHVDEEKNSTTYYFSAERKAGVFKIVDTDSDHSKRYILGDTGNFVIAKTKEFGLLLMDWQASNDPNLAVNEYRDSML